MAQIGHNSDSAEEKAVFFQHLNAIVAGKQKLDEVQASYKEMRKLAKAAGIKLSDMDFAMKVLDTDDESIIADDLRRRMNISRWMNLPIGHQMDFAEADRRDAEEKAFNEGEFAGMRGLPNNEHGYKGNLEQEFLKGWHAGQERVKSVSEQDEKEGAEILEDVGNGGATDEDPFEDDQTGDKGNVPEAEAAE